jgi:hypothetical protein
MKCADRRFSVVGVVPEGAWDQRERRPVATPRINFGASIRDLLHEVRLIRSALEAQIERLDRIERDLVFLSGIRTTGAGNLPPSGTGPVAYNLDMKQRADGSVELVIDGGDRFSLGPRLAEVFQFLASGDKDRSGKDPLAGWRSRTEIIEFLEKHTGKRFSKNYVNGMVYLLKKALTKARYDRGLIQTHRQKGVRLAYKRGAQGLLETSV